MRPQSWRHYLSIALAVLLGVLLWQSVASLQAAGSAGEVVVYSARIEALIKPMFDAFTEKTGIQVKYFTAGEKELFERLQSEGVNTPADVFMTVDVGNLWLAQNAGLLQGIDSEIIDQNIPTHLVGAKPILPTRALQHMLGVHIGVAIWRQHIGQSRHDEDQAGDDHAKHGGFTSSQATERNAPRT